MKDTYISRYCVTPWKAKGTTVNSNTVNSKFHQFEVNLTGVKFEVTLIRSFNSKFVLIQSKSSL